MVALFATGFALRVRIQEEWYLWRLEKGDEDSQWAAAHGLAQMRSERSVPAIVRLTLDPARHRTFEPVAILGSEAVPLLAEALSSPDDNVRLNAMTALGQIGKDASLALPALTEILADPDWILRRHAARTLGEIGPAAKAALEALRSRLDDPHFGVRDVVAEALGKIQGESP